MESNKKMPKELERIADDLERMLDPDPCGDELSANWRAVHAIKALADRILDKDLYTAIDVIVLERLVRKMKPDIA